MRGLPEVGPLGRGIHWCVGAGGDPLVQVIDDGAVVILGIPKGGPPPEGTLALTYPSWPGRASWSLDVSSP